MRQISLKFSLIYWKLKIYRKTSLLNYSYQTVVYQWHKIRTHENILSHLKEDKTNYYKELCSEDEAISVPMKKGRIKELCYIGLSSCFPVVLQNITQSLFNTCICFIYLGPSALQMFLQSSFPWQHHIPHSPSPLLKHF